MDEFSLNRLENFSYRCEGQGSWALSALLRNLADALVPAGTSPVVCAGASFLAAFGAAALCSVARGGALDGVLLPEGVLSAVLGLLALHVAA